MWQKFGKIGLGVKVPKLEQTFGKLGSGWKFQNWQIFAKLASGNSARARAKFRKYMFKLNWKAYQATVDQGGIEPPTNPD